MQIIAHRGFWCDSALQIAQNRTPNSLESFERAFQNGFGVESDLRDCYANLVISHDIPNANAIHAKQLFALYQKFARESNTNLTKLPPLALNIKADGLQNLLKNLLEKYQIQNYFCFDMSVPDMRYYAHFGLTFFTRQSEIEQTPALYDEAEGVWCDEFYSHWISESTILAHLENGKKVAIVSPELHKRDHKSAWHDYKQILYSHNLQDNKNIFLCTDFPHLAREFFANSTTKDFLK
ncbi:hypothetical protein [Helicobacter sp. T3_23-1059]